MSLVARTARAERALSERSREGEVSDVKKVRTMSRVLVMGFLAAVLITACENAQFGAREKGALTGGALGAGLGAIVGNQVGSTGAGIAIGSAIGAISGGIIGNQVDNQNQALDERDAVLRAQEQELEQNRRLIEELRRRGADARLTDRGVVVNLPDVLFEFDSARLTPDARRTARDIADVIRTGSSGRHLSVEGHTDSTGTLAYNQRLSEDRARAVADQLVRDGIDHRAIATRGFGESRPIASNKSESGRQRNRRVEVVIENR